MSTSQKMRDLRIYWRNFVFFYNFFTLIFNFIVKLLSMFSNIPFIYFGFSSSFWISLYWKASLCCGKLRIGAINTTDVMKVKLVSLFKLNSHREFTRIQMLYIFFSSILSSRFLVCCLFNNYMLHQQIQ